MNGPDWPTQNLMRKKTSFIRRSVQVALSVISVLAVASANADSWQAIDIGLPLEAPVGTSVYQTPASYAVNGGGSGFSQTGDSFTFVRTRTSGNIELETRITSLEEASSGGAGIMVRAVDAAASGFAYIGINQNREVGFYWRQYSFGSSSNELHFSLGTTFSENDEIWLRLVRSGGQIAGYYSKNGINWTAAGTGNVSISGPFQAGLAVNSGSPSAQIEAEFDHVSLAVNVPQRATASPENLAPVLWLRADWNSTFDSTGKVSKWEDFSGYVNDAIATNSGSSPDNRPTIFRDQIGQKPAMRFENTGLSGIGERKYFTVLPSETLNVGTFSIFVVARWSALQADQAGLVARGGTTTASGGYALGFAGGKARLRVATQTETTGVSLALNQAHLIEGSMGPEDETYRMRVFTNSTVSAAPYPTRASVSSAPANTPMFIGQFLNSPTAANPGSSSIHPFSGDIAEIIVYNGEVTENQRAQIELYFKSKYSLANIPSNPPEAPTLSLPGGIYDADTTLLITNQTPGSYIYYRINGGDVMEYGAGILLQTGVNKITTWEEVPGLPSGQESEAVYIVDPQTKYVSKDELKLWLRSDAGIVTDSNNEVVEWRSQASAAKASAGAVARPEFVPSNPSDLAGIPMVRFNEDYLRVNAAAGTEFALNKHTIYVIARPSATTGGTSTGSFSTLLSRLNATNGYLFGFKTTLDGAMSPVMQMRSRLVLGGQTSDMEAVSPLNLPVPLGQWNVLSKRFDGQAVTLNRDGKQIAKKLRTLAVGNSGTNLFLGAQTLNEGLPVNTFDGEIAEILVYNKDLTDRELRELHSYAALRYGFTAVTLQPEPHLAVSPPGGIYGVPPTVVASSDDNAAITFRINDGPEMTTSSPGQLSLANYEGEPLQHNMQRYKVQVWATKEGFSSMTPREIVYFVDPAAAEIPRDKINMWLRADVGAAPATAPARLIDRWNDQSGNLNHLKVPEGVVKPFKVLNALEGKPSISFGSDGLSQMIALAAGNQPLSLGSIPNNDITVVAVVKDSGSPDGAVLVEQEDISKASGFSLRMRDVTGGKAAESRFNASTTIAQAGGVPYLLPEGFNLVVQRAKATSPRSHALTVNRNSLGTQSGYAADSSATDRYFSLGARRNAEVQSPSDPLTMPTLGFNGQIAELIVCDSALSDQELLQLETYLAARYNLGKDARVNLPSLALPTATPDVGTWQSGVLVTAAHASSGVTLSYRITSGTVIDEEQNWILYGDPFPVSGVGPFTVQIQAYKVGYLASIKTFVLNVDLRLNDVPRNGMAVWLSSDRGVETVTSFNPPRISKWNDQSGSGNHAVPFANHGPDYILSDFISYNPVGTGSPPVKAMTARFNGNRRLKINNIDSLGSSMTVFIVARSGGMENPRVILQKCDLGTYGAEGGFSLFYQNVPGKVGMGGVKQSLLNPPVTTGFRSLNTSLITATTAGELEVLSKKYSTHSGSLSEASVGNDLVIGGSDTFRFFGQTYANSDWLDNILPEAMVRLAPGMALNGGNMNGLTLKGFLSPTRVQMSDTTGGDRTGNFFANSYMYGEIAELLVYSRQLSQNEKLYIQDYLATKYNFVYKHPLPAPTIKIGSGNATGVYTTNQSVVITGAYQSDLHYTVNGVPGTAHESKVVTVEAVPGQTVVADIVAWNSRLGYPDSAKSTSKVIIDPTAGFVPAREHLQLWVRGDSARTHETGSSVSSWLDISGHGRHLAKPKPLTVSAPSVLTTSSEGPFRGKPVVQFSSTAKTCLEGNYPELTAPNVSVFAVLRRGTHAGTGARIIAEMFHLQQGYTLTMTNTTAPKYVFRTHLAVPKIVTESEEEHPVVIVGGTHSPEAVKLYYQGNELLSKPNVTNADVVATTKPFRLGGRRASLNFDGEIADLWVFNKALSPAEISQLSVYAHQRYGSESNKQVPPPVANFQGGTFPSPINVELSSPGMPEATLYYELGEPGQLEVPDPTGDSPVYYPNSISSRIPITGSLRILKVMARRLGHVDSEIKTWVYQIGSGNAVREGLFAWFKADRGVTLDSNSKVVIWEDQSGLANHAVPLSDTLRPTQILNSAHLNDAPVIRFNSVGGTDGIGLKLAHPLKLQNGAVGLNQMSVVAVVRKTGTNNGIVAKKGGYWLRVSEAAGLPAALWRTNETSMSVPIRQDEFEVITATYDQATKKLSNGSTIKQANFTQAVTQDALSLFIGATSPTSAVTHLQGEIAELLFFSRGLSDAEIGQIEMDLKEDYAVTGPLEVKAAPPRFVPGTVAATTELDKPQQVVLVGGHETIVYYTTDPALSSSPSSSTWTPYTGPVTVNHTTTIWAFCVSLKAALSNSDPVYATFELDALKYPAPTMDSGDVTPPVITLEKPTNAVEIITP